MSATILDDLPDPESEDYYEQVAGLARLVYVSDELPGYSRRKHGKGFSFRQPDGSKLVDRVEIDRLKMLAVPPAYSNVWYSTEPRGHIQATGRDEKGRKQYRYHDEWLAFQNRMKFATLTAFGGSLPALRQKINADLRRHGLPKDKVLALIVWLLDNTLIRIGNAKYVRQNKSFGLTTLRKRHLDVGHSKIRFTFRGKSGKAWDLSFTDRRIARVIRSIHDLPGQHLFEYVDEHGARHPVRSHDVNEYIRSATGHDFTAKDFRTWSGTVLAADALRAVEVPESKRMRSMTLNQIIDEVCATLGNTRAVCRSQYIHPQVFRRWEDGVLAEEIRSVKPRHDDHLEEDEAQILSWLEQLDALTDDAAAA